MRQATTRGDSHLLVVKRGGRSLIPRAHRQTSNADADGWLLRNMRLFLAHSRVDPFAWRINCLEQRDRNCLSAAALSRQGEGVCPRAGISEFQSGVIVRPESSMNERPVAAQVRARTALGVVVLACIAALAAEAGVIAAGIVGSYGRGAAPPAADRLVRPGGSGPASFADVVDAVRPAVVGVQTKTSGASDDPNSAGASHDRLLRPFDAPQVALPGARRPARVVTSQGSGFFISADGYLVTNHHVVEDSPTAEVQTDDQRTYTAKVVGTDPTSDLALLKVDGRSDFPYVKLADKMPRVGDWVLAVGNPFGLGGTVTAGIVSARERNIGGVSSDNLVQIDAPINKGDSGGPSFDVDGRVIGVNMMIFSPSGGSIGIAFAIPAETVRTVVPQLRDKGSVTRGWLGVQTQGLTPDLASALGLQQTRGALIAAAEPDGPAAKAGITAGDVIASVNGAPIRSGAELSRTISAFAPGTSVRIGVLRQGEEKSIVAAVGQLPESRPAPGKQQQEEPDQETTGRGGSTDDDLGLKLAPASSILGAGEQGVLVTGVDPTGLAADQGLELGDVILEVSGKSVATPAEIRSALGDARRDGKQQALLRLRSGDATRFVAVPID
jgi:serine protease Do